MTKAGKLIWPGVILLLSAGAGLAVYKKKDILMRPGADRSDDPRKDPTLLVIQEGQNGCAVKIQKVTDSAARIWFELPACPEETQAFLFDPERKRALVFVEGKYWKVEMKPGAVAAPHGEGFRPSVNGVEHPSIWIDRTSRALRSVVLIEEPTDLRDNPEGDEWRKKFPLLKDSWISLHAKDGMQPPGAPAVAVVAELDQSGHWRELAQQKTTCCADGAGGTEAVREFIDPDPGAYTLSDLLMKDICQTTHCNAIELHPSEETRTWLREKFAGEGEEGAEGFGYLPFGENGGLLYKLEFGDSLHALNPVYYCQDECAKRTLLADTKSAGPQFSQITVAKRGSYVLISSEYDGNNARIYKAGSAIPTVEFPMDARVVWLPDGFGI